MTSTTTIKKLGLVLAAVVGTSTGMLLGVNQASATTFSYTSERQTDTLFYPNQLIFDIEDAPIAASDVTLNIAAFGDFDRSDEYLNVFGRGEGEPNWTQLEAVFIFGGNQYRSELTESQIISSSLFNSWVSAGNGDIEIQLTPTAEMHDLYRNRRTEYAYIAELSYETRTVPEPASILGILAVGTLSLGFLKRKG